MGKRMVTRGNAKAAPDSPGVKFFGLFLKFCIVRNI